MNATTTVPEILQTLARSGKPVSKMQLYRYLRELSIAQPVRQRPARFPSDTAARILKHLGLPLVSTSPAQLPTLAQLKQERAKARKGK